MALRNSGVNSLYINQRKRNVGIELLRIVSMFMIVIHHVIMHGRMLGNDGAIINSYLAEFINIVCYFAVNLYALITGYVCVNSKHRISRIIELWLEVVTYCLLISIVFYFFGNSKIGIGQVLFSFFPVLNYSYWYFTAYFCLFFFIPFINILIHSITIKQQRVLITIAVLFFSIFPTLSLYFSGDDIFLINHGYSTIWLIILYFIGAHLKICKDINSVIVNKKLIYYLLGYLLSVIIIFSSKCVFTKFNENFSNILVSYNSIPYLIGAVCLFLFFSNLKKIRCEELILKIAPTAFSVYIISDNPLIRDSFMMGTFRELIYLPWFSMVAMVIAISLAIYVICTIIDCIRIKIFKLIHIRLLCENLVVLVKTILQKIYTYIKVIIVGQNAKGTKNDK